MDSLLIVIYYRNNYWPVYRILFTIFGLDNHFKMINIIYSKIDLSINLHWLFLGNHACNNRNIQKLEYIPEFPYDTFYFWKIWIVFLFSCDIINDLKLNFKRFPYFSSDFRAVPKIFGHFMWFPNLVLMSFKVLVYFFLRVIFLLKL